MGGGGAGVVERLVGAAAVESLAAETLVEAAAVGVAYVREVVRERPAAHRQ